MSDVEELLQEVSAYLKPEDVDNIQRAVELSKSAHHGQLRQSGEAYVTHPIAVARILTSLHLDTQAIIAALLHDVVEDTDITVDDITAQFGKPVGDIVEGLSKLDKLQFETVADAQAENFRKMLMAMARDVRVILIKLADRLHNMRTLGSVSREKSTRIARETMEIYAPISNRLGLNDIFHELQDLSFKYLHPNRYNVLSKALKMARGNRREVVGKIQDAIRQRLSENNIHAEIKGREKHVYGIYQKMQVKSLAFSQVLDIYGFRVLVDDVNACYIALGLLHGLYKPIPGKFKDYIAIPKANGYQSLHTTLFGPFGTPIEVQIRTVEMARIADAGVASHWLYKTTEAPINELHVKTHQWLQGLLESLSQSGDSVEFLEHLKVDESAALGERLLNQALNSLGLKLADIDEASWEKLIRESSTKSRHEVYADIGLGRSLNTVIARELARVNEDTATHEAGSRGVITILGTEGMAIQFGKCCMPIPGDPIIGVIKSGHGLVVHTHDCNVLRKGRNASDDSLDVAWDKNINKLFDVSIKLIVANQRGVLAKVATAIADAESNIENVNFSNEGDYTALYFTLQVHHRVHLANVMRNLRLIPEVIRITRIKSNQQSGQIKQQ